MEKDITEQSTKRSLNSFYDDVVRDRLIKRRTELEEIGYDLNFAKLSKQMYNIFGIEASDQKLRKMFSNAETCKTEIKLPEAVALAYMLDIPLSKLLAPPIEPAMSSFLVDDCPWLRQIDKSSKPSEINKLSNRFYTGQYYAYYFEPKHYDRAELGGKSPLLGMPIEEAHIEIKIDKGEPYLIFEEMTEKESFYGDKYKERFSIRGKLFVIESSKIAYSFITDPRGKRAMAIMFEYKDFSKDVLYYRTASMLTFSLNDIRRPLFQKIALFRVKQDLNDISDEHSIRGILALNTGQIMIEKNVFEKNKNEKDSILQSLEPSKEESYYIFSEAAIRDNMQDLDADTSVKVLLKLRELSAYQAHEIVSEPEYFQDFIKRYQINHKNYQCAVEEYTKSNSEKIT